MIDQGLRRSSRNNLMTQSKNHLLNSQIIHPSNHSSFQVDSLLSNDALDPTVIPQPAITQQNTYKRKYTSRYERRISHITPSSTPPEHVIPQQPETLPIAELNEKLEKLQKRITTSSPNHSQSINEIPLAPPQASTHLLASFPSNDHSDPESLFSSLGEDDVLYEHRKRIPRKTTLDDLRPQKKERGTATPDDIKLRNRLAARRSRMKKQNHVDALSMENAGMRNEIQRLKDLLLRNNIPF